MASTASFTKRSAPQPAAAAPVPAVPQTTTPTGFARPTPAPVVAAPIPVVATPTPAPVVATPTPAPVVAAPAPVATPNLPAVVEPTESDIVPADFYAGIGNFEGEWSAKDMSTPYLSLVGKMSEVFDSNPDWLGQFLYDKQYPLGTEIRVVFLRATRWFVEDLPFESEKIAQRFSRMADARAQGFNEANLVDAADLDLLVEVDASIEGAEDLAHIIDNGRAYMLARYCVRKSSFSRTAGILAKDMGGFLRGNLINGFYKISVSSKPSPKGGGNYYVPTLKTDGKTPDSLKSQIVERCSLSNAA